MQEKRSIPDFIIVGAMKSGTTTLSHHFSNHKNIRVPDKEVHFFNRDDRFKKGVEWYQQLLRKEAIEDTLVVGEKTPAYSYQENVPKRIYDEFPDVKLIWVFRNPAERTYSNYLHAYKQGKEILSFEDAIAQESDRIKEDIFKGYKKRSIYQEQVGRYLNYFSRDQMFFLLFEDLIQPYNHENHVLIDLFDFLEVPVENFTYDKGIKNITRLPRFQRLWYYFRKTKLDNIMLLRLMMKAFVFVGVKHGYPKMSPEVRKELVDYFKPYNKSFGKLINRDLSIWDK